MERKTNQLFSNVIRMHEKDLLREFQHTINYEAGETIFKQSSLVHYLYWIENGMVKACITNNNKRTTISRLYSRGEFIELGSLFSDKNMYHDTSAIAITTVTLGLIEYTKLNDIISKHPQFSVFLLKKIADENMTLKHSLISRSTKNLPGRVADILLYFYYLNGQKFTFEIPLSRTELAQLISTTKESFIRTLSEFKHDKIIEIDHRHIKINSLEIINALSLYG